MHSALRRDGGHGDSAYSNCGNSGVSNARIPLTILNAYTSKPFYLGKLKFLWLELVKSPLVALLSLRPDPSRTLFIFFARPRFS